MNTSENREHAFLQFLYRSRFLNTLAIFVALAVLFAIISPGHNFTRPGNLMLLMAYTPEVVLIVLGVGLLMVAGEFDLSVGAVLTFCSFVFFWSVQQGLGPYAAALLAIAAGAIAGTINGVITTKGRIISFVVTLGAMLFWRGFTVMISLGNTESIDLSAFPEFRALFIGRIGGVFPVQSIWLIVAAIVLALLLHKTKFGNWIFATGNNVVAARAMAVNTDLVKILCFAIVGVLVGLTATMQMTRTAVFSPLLGVDLFLKILAAAVIGGVSIRGGKGSMIGVILGGFVIMVIENGLSLSRIAFEWTYILFGVIVMFSVSMDIFMERLLRRSS